MQACAAHSPRLGMQGLCGDDSALCHLQDPDASNEETDELLSKQFAQLGDALGDAAPAVRAAAVAGVCQLLSTFWELIPAAVTAGFLKRIAGADQPNTIPWHGQTQAKLATVPYGVSSNVAGLLAGILSLQF